MGGAPAARRRRAGRLTPAGPGPPLARRLGLRPSRTRPNGPRVPARPGQRVLPGAGRAAAAARWYGRRRDGTCGSDSLQLPVGRGCAVPQPRGGAGIASAAAAQASPRRRRRRRHWHTKRERRRARTLTARLHPPAPAPTSQRHRAAPPRRRRREHDRQVRSDSRASESRCGACHHGIVIDSAISPLTLSVAMKSRLEVVVLGQIA
jgi:hypothetical protein